MWFFIALFKIIFEIVLMTGAIYIVCNNVLHRVMKPIDLLDALSIYTSAIILIRIFEMFN